MDKRKEIERLAYEIYERSGYICGRDFDHWIEAERIICARCEPEVPVKKKTVRKSPGASIKAAEKSVPAARKTVTARGRSTGRPKKGS